MKKNKHVQEELPLVEADRLRHAYSVAFHSTQGGDVHVIVGRMDAASKRYTFRQAPGVSYPPGSTVCLSYVLADIADALEVGEEDDVLKI